MSEIFHWRQSRSTWAFSNCPRATSPFFQRVCIVFPVFKRPKDDGFRNRFCNPLNCVHFPQARLTAFLQLGFRLKSWIHTRRIFDACYFILRKYYGGQDAYLMHLINQKVYPMTLLNPQAENFHIVLRDKRNALNLTQNQLADALGISSVMTQRYEMERSKKNSARPGPETMKKIEAFFAQPTEALNKRPLQDFSLDQLLDEVRQRGYKLTLSDV